MLLRSSEQIYWLEQKYTHYGAAIFFYSYSTWSGRIFKAASMQTDLVPKIAVYSTEKMEELIRLVEEHRQRSMEHRRYMTRPEGSMAGLGMRWHPADCSQDRINYKCKPCWG